MQFYSQRDPRWAKHVLGWGPALGTIGDFGCYDTVCAMIAFNAGSPSLRYDPATFDVLATAKKVFVQDPTGTYDFLPDNALDLVFPGRFKTTAYAGFRADLIAAAIPTKDTFAYVHISTQAVPTHYVWMFGTDKIVDPWYGKLGSLAGYGGPGAVVKTHIVKALPLPPPVVVPPVVVPPITPPVVKPPEPLPVPTPSPDPVPPAPIPLPTPPPIAAPPGGWQAFLDWLGQLLRSLMGRA